jgi:hypothetical protein
VQEIKISEKFSAETEFCKIDPRSDESEFGIRGEGTGLDSADRLGVSRLSSWKLESIL